jgi:hypothetical protein
MKKILTTILFILVLLVKPSFSSPIKIFCKINYSTKFAKVDDSTKIFLQLKINKLAQFVKSMDKDSILLEIRPQISKLDNKEISIQTSKILSDFLVNELCKMNIKATARVNLLYIKSFLEFGNEQNEEIEILPIFIND